MWVFKGGKGWGKGWGKGKVQKSWTKAPAELPANFVVQPNRRYKGKVSGFWKFSGYGFIECTQKGVVPEDKVFVYWDQITSADRFPSLQKDMEVEFSLKKTEKRGKTVLAATNVTLPGGSPVSLQDEADTKRTFVGGQNLRYTGNLKFYNPKKGFGYIAIDDGFVYDGHTVPKEIRVERSEVNAGGKQPTEQKEIPVEFGIWKTKQGAYKAYNMTAPGGVELPGNVMNQ